MTPATGVRHVLAIVGAPFAAGYWTKVQCLRVFGPMVSPRGARVLSHYTVIAHESNTRTSHAAAATEPPIVTASQAAVGGLLFVAGFLVHGILRRRAERHSQHSEARYRSVADTVHHLEARHSAIVRALPDLMFVLAYDGTYLDVHARDSRLLVAPPDQFLGKTVREIMPPEVADPLMAAIEAARTTTDPVVVEYELTLDEPRVFEARLVSIDDDRVLSIVRDMTDSRRALEHTRDLAGRLITSQEEERMRIARDLHDGICQEVAAIGVDVSNLRHRQGPIQEAGVQALLSSIQQRATDVAAALRLLAHGLHATTLHQVGLVAALQTHCAEIERQHGVQLTLNTDGDVEPANRPVALSLFRITQEALGNAVRHGRARRAAVSLSRDESNLTLTVTDDGIGFDVPVVPHRAGLGLVSMSERARLIRGRLNIQSRRNGGTTVEVRVPVDAGTQPRLQRDYPSNGGAVGRQSLRSGREA